MILLARGAGDPDRIAHAVRILRPSPLDDVADAVAAYADSGGRTVYVERDGDQDRWSPATHSSYPLVRVLARFLGCLHTEITISFMTVDGWCIIHDHDQPRAWTYVILDNIPRDVYWIDHSLAEALLH